MLCGAYEYLYTTDHLKGVAPVARLRLHRTTGTATAPAGSGTAVRCRSDSLDDLRDVAARVVHGCQ